MALQKVLNEYQFNKLNLIENTSKRKSLISVLSYMIIVNEQENDKCRKGLSKDSQKNIDQLKMSFSKLREKYIVKHKKISSTTLKERIYQLVELGLLKISKSSNVNLYNFITAATDIPTDIPTDISASCESSSTQENTMEDDVDIFSKSSPISFILEKNKDLDSKVKDEVEYERYIDSEEKVCDWSIVCDKFDEICKSLKIRSCWIKKRVEDKLKKYYRNITAKYLDSYIVKAISNAQADSRRYWETKRNENYQAPKKSKSIAFVDNYEGRNYSDAQYKSIENRLLGWD